MNKSDIQKAPADYLYVFVNDNFLKLVARYISTSAAQTIKQKKEKQQKVLTNVYGSYANVVSAGYKELSGWIYDAWGYTPQDILKKLLAGQECAGKNWAKGIYGIGKTYTTGWTKNSDFYVDTTGALKSRSGAAIPEPILTYDKNGNVIGKSYTIGNNTFSINYVAKNKGWYAGAMSDADGIYNPDGSNFTGADSSSIWESVNSSFSYFSSFIEWLFNLLGYNKDNTKEVITTKNTLPSQTELSTRTTKKSSNNDIILLGGIGLAAYLFLGDNKKK